MLTDGFVQLLPPFSSNIGRGILHDIRKRSYPSNEVASVVKIESDKTIGRLMTTHVVSPVK